MIRRVRGSFAVLPWIPALFILSAGPAVHAQESGSAAMTVKEAVKDAGMTGEAKPNVAGPVTIETIPAMTVLVLPMTGSYAQHSDAIMKLMGIAMQKGIAGPPFGVYHNSPKETAEADLKWDVCVKVAEGSKAEAPFEVRSAETFEAAVMTCTGPYEQTGPCCGVLDAWLEANGYSRSGPPREEWLGNPAATPAEELQARIVYPVEKG